MDLRSKIFENIEKLAKDEYPSIKMENADNFAPKNLNLFSRNNVDLPRQDLNLFSVNSVDLSPQGFDLFPGNDVQFSMVAADTYQKIIENIHERLADLEQQLEQISLDAQMNCEKCEIDSKEYCQIDPESIHSRLNNVRERIREIDAEVNQKKLSIDLPELTMKLYEKKNQILEEEQECILNYKALVANLEPGSMENQLLKESVVLSNQLNLIEDELDKVENSYNDLKNEHKSQAENAKRRKRNEILREKQVEFRKLRKNHRNITSGLSTSISEQRKRLCIEQEKVVQTIKSSLVEYRSLTENLLSYLDLLAKLSKKLSDRGQRFHTYFRKVPVEVDQKQLMQYLDNNISDIDITKQTIDIRKLFDDTGKIRVSISAMEQLKKGIQKLEKSISSLFFPMSTVPFDDRWQNVFEKIFYGIRDVRDNLDEELENCPEKDCFELEEFSAQTQDDLKKLQTINELIKYSREILIPEVEKIIGLMSEKSEEIFENIGILKNSSCNEDFENSVENKLRKISDIIEAKKCSIGLETQKKIAESDSVIDQQMNQRNEQNELMYNTKKKSLEEHSLLVMNRLKAIQKNLFSQNLPEETKMLLSSSINQIIEITSCLREKRRLLFEAKKDIEKLSMTRKKSEFLPGKISQIKELMDRTENLIDDEKREKVFNFKMKPQGIFSTGLDMENVNVGDLLKLEISMGDVKNVKNFDFQAKGQMSKEKKNFDLKGAQVFFDLTKNSNLKIVIEEIDGKILHQENINIGDLLESKKIHNIENEYFIVPLKFEKYQ